MQSKRKLVLHVWPPGATIFASYLNSITEQVNVVSNSINGLAKHLDAIEEETCFTCCSILDKAIVGLNSKKAVIKSYWPPGATIFASHLDSITGLVNLVLNSITGLAKHLDAIKVETSFTCCSILDKAIVCLNSKKAVIKSLQDLLFSYKNEEKKCLQCTNHEFCQLFCFVTHPFGYKR